MKQIPSQFGEQTELFAQNCLIRRLHILKWRRCSPLVTCISIKIGPFAIGQRPAFRDGIYITITYTLDPADYLAAPIVLKIQFAERVLLRF